MYLLRDSIYIYPYHVGQLSLLRLSTLLVGLLLVDDGFSRGEGAWGSSFLVRNEVSLESDWNQEPGRGTTMLYFSMYLLRLFYNMIGLNNTR